MITGLALSFGFTIVQAAAPWKWQLTLQTGQEYKALASPTAIYVDQALERYYVSDSRNNRLVSFDRTGKFLNALTANNKLQAPFDLVRQADGAFMVVEKGSNSLTKIDLKSREVISTVVEYRGETVSVDRLENYEDVLYVLDKASGAVLALDKDLKVTASFSCQDCDLGFVDFKVDRGMLWALSQKEKSIYRFARDGALLSKISLSGRMEFPQAFAVGDGGLFYVVDRHRGAVAVFNENGDHKYSFLVHGQTQGRVYFPIDVLFDPWGNLCVVEEGNGRVQIFSRQ